METYLPATITTVAENPVYLNGINHVKEKAMVDKPHPVDEFAFEYYKTLDTMRLEFGDVISLKFQKEREPKEKQKAVLASLLTLRSEEFTEKVKAFFTDIEAFLTRL
nr:MAG: hypothetical protein [Lake Baikal virophage 3]